MESKTPGHMWLSNEEAFDKSGPWYRHVPCGRHSPPLGIVGNAVRMVVPSLEAIFNVFVHHSS